VSIIVSGLTKHFGQQTAVNNISFTVNKGEIVGFLGPNGAGKSTTMKMITGYLVPDKGEILVCDEVVEHEKINTKKKIGYLPESNPLYTDMYVREYLGFVAGIHKLDQPGMRIASVIEMVGLDKEANKKIKQLSKGYKQRVGLAAAMIHDPEVLILDEPTSGLDPNQILEIRSVIKKLGETKTILFSSHIMQEIESICKKVIILNHGNIVANDSLDNLQRNGINNHFISVTFKGNNVEQLLNQLANTININKISDVQYVIETEQPDVVKKQLIELSLTLSAEIVSLNSEKQDLESVFKMLTK
jgi:ABC-2 type transport system ATP-binding protein